MSAGEVDIYKCETLKHLDINTTTGQVSIGESKSLVIRLDKVNKKLSVVGFLDGGFSYHFTVVNLKELTAPKDISFSAERDTDEIKFYDGKFTYMSNLVGEADFYAMSVIVANCHKI